MARAPRKPRAAKATAAAAGDVTMHLYCHGLGDCMLLRLPSKGPDPFWMLIDCGIHTSANDGTRKIRDVVADIALLTGKRLDVVVATHEHWDHISGFHQAEDLFREFTIGEIWFGWTENPADPQARRLDKFKGEAVDALAGASLHFGASGNPIGGDLDALLGFVFGAKGERSRDAREKLRALSGTVRHLEPGTLAPLPASVDAVRVYVLAPPRDEKLLGVTDSATQTYRFGVGASPAAAALRNGFAIGEGRLSVREDPLSPFDGTAGRSLSEIFASEEPMDDAVAFLSAYYAGEAQHETHDLGDDQPSPDQRWRRIDDDWMGIASDLALQLDSRTNNSSLVLAIEIVATGKVLIFAADAQVGNWRSWKDVRFPAEGDKPEVTGAALMGRTVFYKVGHHGSANATLSEDGLELMTSPELTAFIPTDEIMAKKVRWNDIPATGLLARLLEKTDGRLIQSDREWISQSGEAPFAVPSGSLKSLKASPLRVDVVIG